MWVLDLQKHVMLNIFLDVDFVHDFSKRYHVQSQKVLESNGDEIINFSKELSSNAFFLNLTPSKVINFEAFKEKYQILEIMCRFLLIPKHRVKGLNKRHITILKIEKEPFNL